MSEKTRQYEKKITEEGGQPISTIFLLVVAPIKLVTMVTFISILFYCKRALELRDDIEVKVYSDLPKVIQDRCKKQWSKLKKAREPRLTGRSQKSCILKDILFRCKVSFDL